jgi:nitrogen-specific signal transduction histidine kinase
MVEGIRTLASQRRASGIHRRVDVTPPSAASNTYIAALDVTTDAVLICNRAGIVVYVNTACAELLGDQVEVLIGHDVRSLFPVDSRGLRDIVGALQKRSAWHGRVPARPGSEANEVSIGLRTIGLTPRRPDHFCLTVRTRAATDVAVSSALGRVTGEIAHDFNNQIAVILNYSFIMLRQLPEDSPLRSHVGEMQNAAWRASQFAQMMLGLGGGRATETDDVDVNALLDDVQALFASTPLGATPVELHLADDLWRVRMRRAQLERLLVEMTSRLRGAIGQVERFRITTCNAVGSQALASNPALIDAACGGGERCVLISIEAKPLAARGGDWVGDPLRRGFAGAAHTEAAGHEPFVADAPGEYAIQRLPDGSVRFLVQLPAA